MNVSLVVIIASLAATAWVAYLMAGVVGLPPRHALIIWRAKMRSGDPSLIEQAMIEMDQWPRFRRKMRHGIGLRNHWHASRTYWHRTRWRAFLEQLSFIRGWLRSLGYNESAYRRFLGLRLNHHRRWQWYM